jgi:hypothetical protein
MSAQHARSPERATVIRTLGENFEVLAEIVH